ncbi:jg705 [Pararge aegeria aegeria]|uniref:Jg705 protein n=1 Tax=Pararge aegeria aegeria TaxID=348720 RepID=A0A8S4R9M9_9NEOP|nr:jg705 [Pararge aegeria aegeria]
MAGQNPGSPTDFQYFYEDEVYKINNHGQVVFGLVLENFEANSSDQESDMETAIQKGEIRVVWHPSGTERVISEKSVGLADRSLMPGDVVRRLIAGKDTQRGYCRDIVMTAALQIVGTKHVIPNVASERLQPLEEFTPDLAVCLESWVGTSKVSKYYRNIRKQTRPIKKSSKTDTNSSEQIPSRPKKRASSHRKVKVAEVNNEMDVDGREYKLESLDDALREVANCPSIKIEATGDGSLPLVSSSQEDTATEEKNDSGISGLSKSHTRSPEPAREEGALNGERADPNDDDSDNWENTSSDGSDTDSGATWSSRCSSAASGSGRGARSPQLAVRLLRGKRLKRAARRAPPAPPPRRCDRVVVETLHTTSRANVVWQDGTIEMGIPSTQLYPIHHLDGQECFPGDFVINGAANVEENQQVGEYDSEDGELWGSDGSGSEDSWETQSSVPEPRTPDVLPPARSTSDEQPPMPVFASSPSEEQAFVPAESSLPKLLEPRVAAHIERSRLAMRRLEELFAKHPTLQSQEIMRKLLNLYKDCRFLDRLMGTTFFHEDHFLGLLERVRERGASTPRAGERRVHEQLARLFAPTETDEPPTDPPLEEVLDTIMVDEKPVKPIIAANVTVEPMEVESDSPKKSLFLNIEPVQPSSSTNIAQDNATGENAIVDPDGEGSTRNVCHKLCALIHRQLVKAHAEVSRRRPQELAEFLNRLMKKQNVTEENLPYHFSIQYGALVVSIASQDGEPSEGKPNNTELTDATTITALKTEENAPSPLPTSSETAPLATAEGDIDPEAIQETPDDGEGFSLLESAPVSHRFRLSMLQPSEPRSFYSAVKREIKLLKSDLPSGVWVRGYEDRIDLISVMIAGPSRTPYEGGLFVFDVQLGGEYPRAPPLCHYHSYCSDRLNPNLYEDGKVCVSLLGTWSGRGVEVWGKDSSLLQVIVSLQGLILNAEPYFNEAGYEKQKGTQQGTENSRMYNEMVLLKLVQSMTKMITNPPEPFRDEILQHLRNSSADLCRRLEGLVALSNGEPTDVAPPDYPLIPASRGFCLTLRSSLESYRNALRRNDINAPPSTL